LALAENRPAEVCRFPLAPRRAQAGSRLTGLAVQAQAWAQNRSVTDGGAGGADVVLQLWQAGAWAEATRCSADGGSCGPGAPAQLQFASQDPERLTQLSTDLDSVGVAVAPGSPNGSGLDQLGVSALQVVVSYTEP
jgi:hypothetical protein